ncbi:MAG: hypothetical protein ABSA47_09775 [Verrucomicrobiota bacterium]|jgi:hypothetical protein
MKPNRKILLSLALALIGLLQGAILGLTPYFCPYFSDIAGIYVRKMASVKLEDNHPVRAACILSRRGLC